MLVSVVMPAFNVADCIGRAIDSILQQSLQDLELIVIDDCSTDDTVAYVRQRAAQDQRIRLLKNPRNCGPAAARNRGLAAARGEWIAAVDADDACDPRRLATLCEIAQSQRADLIADNLQLYDAVAHTITATALPELLPDRVITIDTNALLDNCITARSKFDFGQLKVMMRRSFLLQHRLFYPEELRHGEDFILYANLLLAGARFVLIGHPYYLFTERVGRVSNQPSGLSRTKINFDAMHRSTLELLSHPAVVADTSKQASLRARASAIRLHQCHLTIGELARKRDVVGLVLACCRDWRTAALLLKKLARRMAWQFATKH